MFKHTYYISTVSQDEPDYNVTEARRVFENKVEDYFGGFIVQEATGVHYGPPEHTLVYTIVTPEERASYAEALASFAAELFLQDSVLLETIEVDAKFVRRRM